MPKPSTDTPQPDTILRLPTVMARTGLSSVTIWRLERSGDFPQRLQLSSHAVGWREDELTAWIADRPRGVGIARDHRRTRARSGPL